MQELSSAISTYSKQHLNNDNDWYDWKINETKLPEGIKLPAGNRYAKNIALKKLLNEKWKKADNQEEIEDVIEYYISTWGGIRTNGSKSMSDYTTQSAEQLIARGKTGIASWSKALVVHNPNEYAIFDARVSVALNCIQKLYDLPTKTLFPVIASRNTTIEPKMQELKELAKTERWVKANNSTFYKEYLGILKATADELDTDISTIEMLLFAKAEELVEQALG